MRFDDYFNSLWKDDENLLCDKRNRVFELVNYMLDRTQQMFVWKGLPETIPDYEFEFMLQTFGNVCVTDVSEKGLYAFYGGLGGVPDAYYNPTIYTVANPFLNFSKNLEIGKECVRVRNDRIGIGLLPMFIKYATMQNENEISLNMLSIVYRIGNIISADDDRTYESAKQYLNDIVAGKFGAVGSSEFFEGLKVDVPRTTQSIKDLIEYEQYLRSIWFNEIGLNSNYNMKRERILESEAQKDDDTLYPLVDNMLDWRQKGIESIKELYGDKYDLSLLSVELNPVWDLEKIYPVSPDEPDEQEELDEPEEQEEQEEPDEPEEQEEPDEPEEQEEPSIEINIDIEGGGEDEKGEA